VAEAAPHHVECATLVRVADRTLGTRRSIHCFISCGGKAGPGSSCAAIVLPIQVLVELEWQITPLRRRFIKKFILACFQYPCMPLLGGAFIIFFSRPVKRKGSSSSKVPQFILEDAIHAPESSLRGTNDKPAHVFEVRICKSMDDPHTQSRPK
jgi:hypothetical protein